MGHKICYVSLSLPVLSNREAYIRGYGVDRMEEHRSYLICCQSIHHDKEYQEKHKVDVHANQNNVKVDVQFFAVEVAPKSKGEFTMKVVANLDPKIPFVP